jgi:integrase/recombinase XerC
MYKTEGFFEYLKFEKRCSTHTVVAYEGDLKQFFSFIEATGVQTLADVNPKTIRAYIVFLHHHGIGPRSIHRKISSINTFFKHLQRQGAVDSNPAQHVVLPKTPKKLPSFLREKEMETLLDHVDFGADFEGVRNKLIIELFYGTGMRLSEMVELRIRDIDLSQKMVKVLGKRNKERLIPLTNESVLLLHTYNKVKEDTFGAEFSPWLLLTNKGDQIYHKLIYRVVNSSLQLVTTLKKKSPHILRHTYATVLLNRGADLNAIKELLGHSSLNATSIYTHISFETINAIYKQAHPRA